MNSPVSFELAKLLKESGFDEVNIYFYTKPKSKMFGIDEHRRYYPIKNTPKKLYTFFDHYALNAKNIYQAPTIAEVVMWLYKKHRIWIVANVTISDKWYFELYNLKDKRNAEIPVDNEVLLDSPTEAYEAAIEYCLNKLI